MNHPITESRVSTTFFSRLWLFWMAVMYMTLLLGLFSTYSETPDLLRGWAGAGIASAVVIFLANYHFIYRPSEFTWPMRYQQALIYFSIQLAMFVALLHVNHGFVGIGFALLGQIFGSLPPRRWPLLCMSVVAILAAPIGLYNQIYRGDWLSLASFLFVISIWVMIGLMLSKLFEQSYALRRMVAELSAAKAELEAGAAQAEELAALRERTRLAREMHDSIGHALVMVNVKLEAAERLYARDAMRGAAELEATRVVVRETMADLRRSLADLRAPLPDYHDLLAALRRVASDTEARSQLAIELSLRTPLPELPAETSEALWRVAREALRNVEQHAAAGSATIDLACRAGSLVLQIRDDGSGIDVADIARPGHYGILGMRERIKALGGRLRVTAHASGGTLVEAQVPIG